MSQILIETVTVDNSLPTNIAFTSIPQTGKHLLFRISVRGEHDSNENTPIQLNTNSGTYRTDLLSGDGSSVTAVSTGAGGSFSAYLNQDGYTANTFANIELFFNHYTDSGRASGFILGSTENNSTLNRYTFMGNYIYSVSEAISTVNFLKTGGFKEHTTFSLYIIS